MYPLRRTIAKVEAMSVSRVEEAAALGNNNGKKGAGKGKTTGVTSDAEEEIQLEMITEDDIALALKRVKPAPLTCEKSKYSAWTEAFGST